MSHSITLNDVQQICLSRGLRLTDQRKAAFETLIELGKPTSAYDVLPALEKRLGRRLAPLTVYRALDFLVEHGFAHKIASNHSYTLCDQPHSDHESLHLLCTQCGSGEELKLGEIGDALNSVAIASDFQLDRRVVELHGLCSRCCEKDHDPENSAAAEKH